MTVPLPPRYRTAEVERRWYARWVGAGGNRPRFRAVTLPPDAASAAPLTEALRHTLADVLVRRNRMRGYQARLLPGPGDTGLATRLGTDGAGGERWTTSGAVRAVFARLHDDGLVHRAECVVDWCPHCFDDRFDAEVERRDEAGELVTVRYGDGDAAIPVGTGRPEILLGGVAVAVHPGDRRYAHLLGAEVALPLTDRRVPVVADERVDPATGTGALGVTPAHDRVGFAIGRRHGLPVLPVLDDRGAVTVPGPFHGLDRKEARPAVVAALREQGRLVAEPRPYRHAVRHCRRCGTAVEPKPSVRWLLRLGPLAEAVARAVRDGRLTLRPAEATGPYLRWLRGVPDRCVSRQRRDGPRVPVWHGPDGGTACVGPDDEPPAGWMRDQSALDPGFLAALWPLAAPEPADVLVTGHHTLCSAVTPMTMLGLYATGRPPFGTVLLHGPVRDRRARMSMWRGPAPDPVEWMDAYGADALRYALALDARPGRPHSPDEERLRQARGFCAKLWNATRFALLHGATVAAPLPPADRLTVADRWVLSRLQDTVAAVDGAFERYEFGRVAGTLGHLVRNEVSGWYLEIAKVQLADPATAGTTRIVLGHLFDTLLRLLHPLVPYVTEELWTALTGGGSVTVAPWPEPDPARHDPAAESTTAAVRALVTAVRRFRADQGLPAGRRVPARVEGVPVGQEPAVRALARLAEPGEGFRPGPALHAGTAVVLLDAGCAVAR